MTSTFNLFYPTYKSVQFCWCLAWIIIFKTDFWNSFRVIFCQADIHFFSSSDTRQVEPSPPQDLWAQVIASKGSSVTAGVRKKRNLSEPSTPIQTQRVAHLTHAFRNQKQVPAVEQLSFSLGFISCAEQLDPAAVLKNICLAALTNSLTWNFFLKEMGQTCSKPG